jgi:hypothetical protein
LNDCKSRWRRQIYFEAIPNRFLLKKNILNESRVGFCSKKIFWVFRERFWFKKKFLKESRAALGSKKIFWTNRESLWVQKKFFGQIANRSGFKKNILNVFDLKLYQNKLQALSWYDLRSIVTCKKIAFRQIKTE